MGSKTINIMNNKRLTEEKVVDPVCGMEINLPSKYFLDLDGKSYDFCSESCRDEFALNSTEYVKDTIKVDTAYNVSGNRYQE